jgi:hypothetical protein
VRCGAKLVRSHRFGRPAAAIHCLIGNVVAPVGGGYDAASELNAFGTAAEIVVRCAGESSDFGVIPNVSTLLWNELLLAQVAQHLVERQVAIRCRLTR